MTKNTGAGAFAVNSVYSLCLKYTLSYQSTLREKMLLLWSLHILSAFFHKISSDVSRNMLEIQTESYFHLIVSKWPISTAKLSDKDFFTVCGTLLVTWRQRKEILSFTHPHTLTPSHPHTLTPRNSVCFVSFLQVRTFHSVWHVRHCTASTAVPKYGPHLVYFKIDTAYT